MSTIGKSLLITTVLASALAVGCGSEESSLTIRNSSSFAFIEINLSPVGQLDWGADLLGSDILEPGDVLELSDIPCDDYDVRVIDEDSDECILSNIELCFDDAEWIINDAELSACVL